MSLSIALAGNPNSGKTTLFNQLTGSSAHVGNWPGVTVERRSGAYKHKKGGQAVEIVDLPGIYSLSSCAGEEEIAGNYLADGGADAVIDVVDATNLVRNLYLTTQLMEMDTPVVVALNMMDELDKLGVEIDIPELESVLGVPVIPISAAKRTGIDALMAAAIRAAGGSVGEDKRVWGGALTTREPLSAFKMDSTTMYPPQTDRNAVIAASNPAVKAPRPVAGTALLERGDDREPDSAATTKPCEGVWGADSAARYQFITKHCEPVISGRTGDAGRSEKLDRILTGKFTGLPIFAGIMFLVFHLTFTENLLFIRRLPGPGAFLGGLAKAFTTRQAAVLSWWLGSVGAPEWLRGLLVDGVLAGAGAVLGFLPLVLMLYLMLSLLESSGYMARAAFLMDRLLRGIGLSGKAFVPLLMGFGCSVPAIAAARSLESERDRKVAVMLVPFMSCSAKLPAYAMLAPLLFPQHTDLVIFAMYALGVAVAIAVGRFLTGSVYKADLAAFVLELPPYRLPDARSTGILILEKLKGFLVKVGTVITVASVAIWFLSSFGWGANGLRMVGEGGGSLLELIGGWLSVLFAPLGFGAGESGWKAATAVLSGLAAREAVVSTLGQLFPAGAGGVAAALSAPAILAMMVWHLLSAPCVAALAAMKQELGRAGSFFTALLMQTGIAWVMTFAVYQFALLGYRLLG